MRQSVEGDFGKLTITADRAPTPDEREFLTHRKTNLDEVLKPSTESAALSEVGAMFSTMRSKTVEDSELAAIIETYAKDLAPLPFFALQQACARFRRGEVGDGVWVPTQGELANEARRIMGDFTDERAAICRVLSAKVIPSSSDESRARMREKFAQLRADLGSKTVERPREVTQAEASAWLEREKAKGPQSIQISAALAGGLGISRPEGEP